MTILDIEQLECIAVTERLPDDDITVLVCAPKSDEPVWLGFYDGVYWFAVGGEDYGEDEDAQVIAWAPMPRGPSQS